MKNRITPVRAAFALILALWSILRILPAAESAPMTGEVRVAVAPAMLTASTAFADFSGLVDEPDTGNPPASKPERGWNIPSQHWKQFPYHVVIDLGQARNLSSLWIYDSNGTGEFTVASGGPDKWEPVTSYDCNAYLKWVRLPLNVTAQRLKIELKNPGANFREIALYEYTPEAQRAMLDRTAAEAKQRAERDAALAKARAEAAARPVIELPPFGRVQLVDEVDCGAASPGHQMRLLPADAARAETLLGRSARVLQPTEAGCAYMAFRLGQWKLLRPGAAYVLAVEYPEDQPRSWIVMNGGNETSRGFHTGATIGDALHPKYVNNLPESLRVPLSGKWEAWTMLFYLHDRFPDLKFIRGAGERRLAAEDGFDVVVAQFSAVNDPLSKGAAVGRIRLYEVLDEKALRQPLRTPPAPLPQRRIFWREEMADGVIDSDKETERGVKEPLDWYRFKAGQMRFLGINTYTKDLLEFGACQHWDPTPYGGNDWVHFNGRRKDLWAQIVALMGGEGFGVLPYYEYSGSRGYKSLGYQRRAKPLTRDDAFTHIRWIENANADITDPDTHADFAKMLDLTVLRLKDKAPFAGAWLRPRSQLPMGFGDGTRARFAQEANGGQAVSREQLKADKALLQRYEDWWFGKRRQFLMAMRDHLRTNGLPEAVILFTADASEPGPGFPTWEKRLVTDDPAGWSPILACPEQIKDKRAVVPIPLERVIAEKMYLEALQSAPLNWGDWEVPHANPPADPARYRDTPGVLLTHAFNRRYTVAAPATFDAFRGPAGLALARHYTLNEDMMFGHDGQPALGYFVADVERAGPYCMMAEALAVANGDPTLLAYLMGNNYGRGFPQYVREFNANFLALPALPSARVAGACADAEIVVRVIRPAQGPAYVAIVNTGYAAKKAVAIRLPLPGAVKNAVTDAAVPRAQDTVTLDFYPFQLRALRVE